MQRPLALQASALTLAAEPAGNSESDGGSSSDPEDDETGPDKRSGDAGAGPDLFEARKRAASAALAFGDGIEPEGRFKDKEFFISRVRSV